MAALADCATACIAFSPYPHHQAANQTPASATLPNGHFGPTARTITAPAQAANQDDTWPLFARRPAKLRVGEISPETTEPARTPPSLRLHNAETRTETTAQATEVAPPPNQPQRLTDMEIDTPACAPTSAQQKNPWQIATWRRPANRRAETAPEAETSVPTQNRYPSHQLPPPIPEHEQTIPRSSPVTTHASKTKPAAPPLRPKTELLRNHHAAPAPGQP